MSYIIIIINNINFYLECIYFVNDGKMFLFKKYDENLNSKKINELINIFNVEKLKMLLRFI